MPLAPEFDEQVKPRDKDQLSVIQAVRAMKDEADWARRSRLRQNERNRDVYLGRQDWGHKFEGQSREFLPKVAVSVEQMTAFVKRALVQFGDWFSMEVDRRLEPMVSGQQLVHLYRSFLDNMWAPNGLTTKASTLISDAVKVGLLESLMIVKVHGGMTKRRNFFVEPGEINLLEDGSVEQGPQGLRTDETDEWRLRIDLIRGEDYYPDPTGNNLYEVHTVERDLYEVLDMAEDGVYDKTAVKELIDTDYPRPSDEERGAKAVAQDEAVPTPGFRKRVVLDEFWGTILAPDGTIAHRNCVCTIANNEYLIRKPEPNPFWHQESPFVAAPLVRVPWSVWHKALYDQASDLNLAINEMFNLMLDGGLAAVWGIKQIRLEDLEDPGQVSGGIPQGTTLAVKGTLPHNAKVVDTVSEGNVPQDAMAVFEFLNREFTQAALTNELKLGALPPKQVRATEVVEASQSQAVTLDGMVADVESTFMTEMLRKGWLTMLQNADDLAPDTLMSLVDSRVALLIMRATPAERFALFANRVKFKVHGLSATMARARDFQKIMAMMQAVTANPLLFQAFMMKFSPEKVLRTLMKTLNVNPEDIEKSSEELARLRQDMEQLPGIQGLLGGGGGPQGGRGGRRGAGLSAESVGEPGLAAQVNQEGSPITGLTPNG